jgi:hypothetical protein
MDGLVGDRPGRMDCWMLRRNALTITSLILPPALPFLYALLGEKKTNSSLALFGSLINNKKCARSLVA